jgi:hypothetical protein
MAYCRQNEHCDVYVYERVRPIDNMDRTEVYLECCCCLLTEPPTNDLPRHREPTFAGMLQHLMQHIGVGHRVPQEVMEKMRTEEPDE